MRALLLFPLWLATVGSAYAGETVVTQTHRSFDSDELTLKAGDVIRFVNADQVTHNIQVSPDAGANADLGLQKPGEALTQGFAQTGHYMVHCSIHPKMKLSVTVE